MYIFCVDFLELYNNFEYFKPLLLLYYFSLQCKLERQKLEFRLKLEYPKGFK